MNATSYCKVRNDTVRCASARTRRKVRGSDTRPHPNALLLLLAVFVAVAVIQSIQLNDLLSETRAVGEDIECLRIEHVAIADSAAICRMPETYYSSSLNTSRPARL